MNVADLISFDFDLRHYRGYSKGIVHDSLVVDNTKNRFYWNSLGISGGPIEWLTQVKGLSRLEALIYLEQLEKTSKAVPEQPISLPESPIYQNLLGIFFELGKKYREYWYARGYSDNTIDRFMLGFTGKCYVIPIIFQEKLYNFQCRTPDKRIWNWTRGTGGLPYNFDVLSNSNSVIITESPVNAIAMHEYGYNAVSQNAGAGSWKGWWNTYFCNVQNIVVAYDHDQAGYHGANKVAKLFKDRVRVLVWPFDTRESYDLNDLLKDGKSKEEVMSLLVNRTYGYEQFKILLLLGSQNANQS